MWWTITIYSTTNSKIPIMTPITAEVLRELVGEVVDVGPFVGDVGPFVGDVVGAGVFLRYVIKSDCENALQMDEAFACWLQLPVLFTVDNNQQHLVWHRPP
jgi:hypothetical protein